MKKTRLLPRLLLMSMILSAVALTVRADTAADEKGIRAVVEHLAGAIRAKDVSAIMSAYVSDESLLVFDAAPPRQYVGAKAYRKAWEEFFAAFPGPIQFDINDVGVTTDGTLGLSHEVDNWGMTDKEGKKVNFVIRETYVYRKMSGKWLIIHEHDSVPVDLVTGKADLMSKP
jgi:uncharacterized protein (TIGR02246 family)